MKIIADENIPYLRGRIGGGAEVIYVDQSEFSRELVRDADALLKVRPDRIYIHNNREKCSEYENAGRHGRDRGD